MGDRQYLAFLRSHCACAAQPCTARAEAHHHTEAPAEQHDKSVPGRRGKSQKADDAFAFPLCPKHHGEFHRASGYFEGWDHAQRRAWQDEQVRIHREAFEAIDDSTNVAAPRVAMSPRATLLQEAEGFRNLYPSIGPQGQHDLVRLLEKVQKEARS
jgi:hypothetical protein